MTIYLDRNIGDEKWSFNILGGEVITLLGGDSTEQESEGKYEDLEHFY